MFTKKQTALNLILFVFFTLGASMGQSQRGPITGDWRIYAPGA
jgi:hypothetical protein